MISVQEAQSIVMSHTQEWGEEEVELQEAVGRVLKEEIRADRDFPPFNRVMMDGIAIDHHAWNDGVRTFSIEGMQPAGSAQMSLSDKKNCLEVMTGAVLPLNTDVVIRYEDLDFETENKVTVKVEEVLPFQNIHLQGTDRKEREVLIKSGRQIASADIAVMATVGKPTVKVSSIPTVAIVSTGDELVNINESPHPYQIRKSNSHALLAALSNMGHQGVMYHFNDTKQEVEEGLSSVFNQHDVVILSGGVSKGKKDYVPEVLEKLKVEKLFHRVKQRPGKPFWFGNRSDGKTVFALPGNPVSTFMCFYKYVKPWLLASQSLSTQPAFARLEEDFEFAPQLTYYLQVTVSFDENGVVMAHPVQGQGSGDLANLLEADAFLELPEEQHHFKKGEVFPLLRYRLAH